MKRNRKFVINCIIIGIILYCFYYFGGFFFSKEECINDTVRAMYGKTFNIVTEFKKGNEYRTLLVDDNHETTSLVGTKKIGFLYQTGGSNIGHKMRKNQSIEIIGEWTRDFGMILVLYRNTEEVEKVIVQLEDGTTLQFDDWKQNFSGQLLDLDNWYNGAYEVYNSNNECIEVIEY